MCVCVCVCVCMRDYKSHFVTYEVLGITPAHANESSSTAGQSTGLDMALRWGTGMGSDHSVYTQPRKLHCSVFVHREIWAELNPTRVCSGTRVFFDDHGSFLTAIDRRAQ